MQETTLEIRHGDKLVIIPTYNERENAEAIIRKVLSLPGEFHVLIIDDNSPDGTAAFVRELAGELAGRLHLLERDGKLGLGTAYIMGFKWALEHGYEYVFEMDADFSHNPDDLPRLLEACENGADLAVGSRYSNGISVINWPFRRVLLSYGASVYVRLVTGMKIYDTTAGFVCYRRRLLEALPLDAIRMKGYGFQIEMKYTALRLGFTVREVPVVFTDRRVGQSKMGGGIFGEALFGVIFMRLRALTTHKH